MELEMKELAPYLPYKLKLVDRNDNITTLAANSKPFRDETNIDYALWAGFKPLLLPLSDLNNSFELNGEKYFPELLMIREHLHKHLATVIIKNRIQTNNLLWLDALTMLKFHFDVFGLIDLKKAVDKKDYEHRISN